MTEPTPQLDGWQILLNSAERWGEHLGRIRQALDELYRRDDTAEGSDRGYIGKADLDYLRAVVETDTVSARLATSDIEIPGLSQQIVAQRISEIVAERNEAERALYSLLTLISETTAARGEGGTDWQRGYADCAKRLTDAVTSWIDANARAASDGAGDGDRD